MKLARFLKFTVVAIYVVCAITLAVFMVPATGLKAKNVVTGSMEPALPTGSLVIIQSVPLTSIHVGDIVTFKNPIDLKQTVTHRVVKSEIQQGITFFTTKGDANSKADPRLAGGSIIGKVIWHVPYVGHVVGAAKTMWGLALFVVIPGLFIIWDEAIRLKKALKVAPQSEAPPAPVRRPVAAQRPVEPRTSARPATQTTRRPQPARQKAAGISDRRPITRPKAIDLRNM